MPATDPFARFRPPEKQAQVPTDQVGNRLRLLMLTGDPNMPFTNNQQRVTGAQVNGAGNGAWFRLFNNTRPNIVGFECLVQWTTAGARLRFARTASDNDRIEDLTNGGVSPGTLCKRMWVIPGGSVWCRDFGGGVSPLVLADLLFPRVCDPAELVKDRYWELSVATP